MGYPFGTSFKYRFAAIVDQKPWVISNDSPRVYVYEDKPSRDQGRAGSGSPIATVTSWAVIDAFTREITIPAVEDPDPNSSEQERTYWIAVNFTTQAGEQEQCELRALEMERPSASDKSIETSPLSLQKIFPTIGSYYPNEGDVLAFIAEAKEHIVSDLAADGYRWDRVMRQDRFTRACTYKALSLAMFQLIQEPGDLFDRKYEEFEKMYSTILKGLKFEYDADNDKQADTAKATTGITGWIKR